MKTNIITFALMAIITSSTFAALKAPMPEFKNEKQLAEWRAGKASQATSQGYTREEPAFYTGKPYLASSGNYAFKYRSYDPEMARWTSEDPSGFPDGANQIAYAPSPTSEVDYEGLITLDVNIPVPWTSTLGFEQNADWDGIYKWDLTKRKEYSDIDPTPGMSGDLPIGGTISVGGVTMNFGSVFEGVTIKKSEYEYQYVGNQLWTRYHVFLREDVYLSTPFSRTLSVTGRTIDLFGAWYE